MRPRLIQLLNLCGLVISGCYLVVILITGASFGFRNQDKEDLLQRIEMANSGKDAAKAARPFLSLMMNVIQYGKVVAIMSCVVTGFNVFIFSQNLKRHG